MNIPDNFITYGYTLKEENFTILSEYIVKNTFVLEEREPYPGYHGNNLPLEETTPGYIFIITKSKVNFEQLHRIQLNMRKEIKTEFVLDMGEFHYRNKIFPFLRLKKIKIYEIIKYFQELIDKEGIQLEKSQHIKDKVIIRIDKYFELEKINENVFKDLEVENIFYLNIEKNLSWEKFVEITNLVRNNMESFPLFDAALSVIYFKSGLLDAVRIYCDKLSEEMLEKLRTKYVEIIDRNLVLF